MVLLRDVAQVESHFRAFRDSVNLDASTQFAPNME
jgi:hypothetical protein